MNCGVNLLNSGVPGRAVFQAARPASETPACPCRIVRDQLELLVESKWKPVVRYDNAHDFPHRDVLDMRGNIIEKKLLNLGTLQEIVEYAEQDLADRVDWYVAKFIKQRWQK